MKKQCKHQEYDEIQRKNNANIQNMIKDYEKIKNMMKNYEKQCKHQCKQDYDVYRCAMMCMLKLLDGQE